MIKKRQRLDRIESEMDTEGGGEVSQKATQCQSLWKMNLVQIWPGNGKETALDS